MRRFMVMLVVALVLAACGGTGGLLGGGDDATAAVDAVETLEVDYYFACGNEVLELSDGRRFYPLVDQDSVDEGRYVQQVQDEQDEQAIGREIVLAMQLAVVAPGPGDDTGTLTVYEDGMAHFVSDSGIEAWLTDARVEYGWEC